MKQKSGGTAAAWGSARAWQFRVENKKREKDQQGARARTSADLLTKPKEGQLPHRKGVFL